MSEAATALATRLAVEQLSSLGDRFRMWQNRQGPTCFKMPSYLWDDAFKFVPIFGARRVAREIGLSRDELLRRMNEEQGPATAAAPASVPAHEAQAAAPSDFLELEMEWPGVAMPPAQPAPVASPAPPPSTAPEPESPPPMPPVAVNTAPASDVVPTRAEEALVEVVAADGAKLSIRIPVSHLMNVSALVREFRSPQ